MENRYNFDNDMEATPDQLNAVQAFVETSLDHVVGDTIVPNRAYAGLVLSKSADGLTITVGAGRLYIAGKVYAFDQAQDIPLNGYLPVAAKRIVLITAYGSEADTNPQQVNYLVEALSTPTAPVYKPQAKAVNHSRLCTIGPLPGTEAPNPQAPIVQPTLLVIGAVTLLPTGIGSFSNNADNHVANLADVADRVDALEAWEAIAAPELAAVSSAVSRLSNGNGVPISADLLGRMLSRLATLEAKDGIPSNAADSSADFFLDTGSSDLAHPLFRAKVEEGIRFADDGANDTALQIFNPLDPNAMIRGGVLFPAYDRSLRQGVGPVTNAVQITAYQYSTVTLVQKTMTRDRIRYGTEYTVCSNSAFWHSGQYDPLKGIFTLPNGETFKVALDVNAGVYQNGTNGDPGSHIFVRLQQFWTDQVDETYWDKVTTTSQLQAAQVYESFACAQDTLLEAIGLTFTKLDAQGAVTLVVCEADRSGVADLTGVLGQVTLAYADLKANAETVFALPIPVYLQTGRRYAFVVMTGSAHFLGLADGTAYPQGTFFTLTAGGYSQADLTKHIAFNLYACKFRNPLVSIQMQNLQLAGGMTSIDILAGTINPDSTALTYEVQLAGVWTPLSGVNAGALNAGGNLPPNVPLRITFGGSVDIMPAVNLLQSNVHVARPRTSLTHISTPLTPPAPSAQIRVTDRFESFDSAFHAASMALLSGAGFATTTAPSSFSDTITDDGGLERTYVWNLSAAVAAFKLQIQMTTTTPLKTAHVAWRKEWSL